jgi:hypothetical protein
MKGNQMSLKSKLTLFSLFASLSAGGALAQEQQPRTADECVRKQMQIRLDETRPERDRINRRLSEEAQEKRWTLYRNQINFVGEVGKNFPEMEKARTEALNSKPGFNEAWGKIADLAMLNGKIANEPVAVTWERSETAIFAYIDGAEEIEEALGHKKAEVYMNDYTKAQDAAKAICGPSQP